MSQNEYTTAVRIVVSASMIAASISPLLSSMSNCSSKVLNGFLLSMSHPKKEGEPFLAVWLPLRPLPHVESTGPYHYQHYAQEPAGPAMPITDSEILTCAKPSRLTFLNNSLRLMRRRKEVP